MTTTYTTNIIDENKIANELLYPRLNSDNHDLLSDLYFFVYKEGYNNENKIVRADKCTVNIYLPILFKINNCTFDTQNPISTKDCEFTIQAIYYDDNKKIRMDEKKIKINDMDLIAWAGAVRRAIVGSFTIPKDRSVQIKLNFYGPCNKCCFDENKKPWWRAVISETIYEGQRDINVGWEDMSHWIYMGCINCKKIQYGPPWLLDPHERKNY